MAEGNYYPPLRHSFLQVGCIYPFESALKNLTQRGNLFEEGMKNLRHLAWTTEYRVDEPELTLLRKQNSVLKEVVKNLKKKVSAFNLYLKFTISC